MNVCFFALYHEFLGRLRARGIPTDAACLQVYPGGVHLTLSPRAIPAMLAAGAKQEPWRPAGAFVRQATTLVLDGITVEAGTIADELPEGVES